MCAKLSEHAAAAVLRFACLMANMSTVGLKWQKMTALFSKLEACRLYRRFNSLMKPPYRCSSLRDSYLGSWRRYDANVRVPAKITCLFQFPHVTGCASVIFMLGGSMLSHLCAATPSFYILWITMAQIAGQDEREKTTALKGNPVLQK